MTITQAADRARLIWGEHRFFSVRMRQDGGADITLLRAGIASDVRGRNYTAHAIDCNGHAVCHTDCETLEAACTAGR